MSKKKRAVGAIFPNLNSTLGSYDPTIQAIFLDCVDKAEYEAIKQNPSSPELARKMAVLIHEVRHYVDHIATLWGHQNILTFQGAASAITVYNEFKLQPVVKYMRQEEQVKQDRYYHETYGKASYDGKPWMLRPSIGLKFDSEGAVDESRPIMFVQIQSHEGVPLCRAPLTIASLLEVNAVSAEVDFRLEHFAMFKNEDTPVYLKLFQDELLKTLIYSQELAVYNAAVHIVANAFTLSDIPTAYRYASSIATIVLNLPDEYVSKIPVADTFRDDNGSFDRVQKAILNKDAGAVFYAMVVNYTKTYKLHNEYRLDELLRTNNLPDEKTFSEFVTQKMLLTAADAGLGRFMASYYSNLLIGGMNVFIARGIDGGNAHDVATITPRKCYPAVFLGDSDIPEPTSPLQNQMKQFAESPAFRYHYVWDLRSRMVDFYNIRGL